MGDKEFFKSLDESGVVRLRFRISTTKGKVRCFVVQLESLIDGEWKTVVRYDNAHGFVHRDVMDAKGREKGKDILLLDVGSSIAFAEQDLVDRWEWYVDSFVKSVKTRVRK